MDTKKLRQKILDLAIHGKLVPQDPNDEPASVLLERIRSEKERLIKEGKIKRSRKTTKTSDDAYDKQEVPFEVPSGWVWATLGEICTFLSRGKSPKYSEERKFPVFAQKCNLKEGGISLKQARFLDPSTIDKWNESYKLKTGDILINSTGTGTVGRTRLFDESFLGAYPFVVPDSHVSVVRTSTKIVSEYVYAYVSSLSTQLYLEENLAGSTNQKELYIGVIERLPLPLPPLAEQQRIVSEIERWSVLIDTIEQGKENLETSIKQAKGKILELAIHGKLVPQDPNDEPASELLKRINPKAEITCDNGHYKQLPKGWAMTSMQEVCRLNDGEKLKNRALTNLDARFLRGLSDGKIIKEGRYVSANTCMILVDGENSGEVFITPTEGYQGSTFKQLSFDVNMNKEYILYIISQNRKALRENKVGSAIPHLNKKLFKAIQVPIPPYAEQERIVSAINNAFNKLNTIKESL